MKEIKMYKCDICGNLVIMMNDSGVTPECCGEPMSEPEINTVDASFEKHVPVITLHEDHITVNIGETDHPMKKEHFIKWIILITDKGIQTVYLEPGEQPSAEFSIYSDERPLAVYAFCNIHGLWKKYA